MSNQRPRTKFIDGVCSACIYLEQKVKNWLERKSDKLEALLDKYRSNNGQWDVVVPAAEEKTQYMSLILKDRYRMNFMRNFYSI